MQTFIEIYPYLKPVIDFTHSTAWGIILCVGWFLTYVFMSHFNKKMRKQCDKLLAEIKQTKPNNDLQKTNSDKVIEVNKKEC